MVTTKYFQKHIWTVFERAWCSFCQVLGEILPLAASRVKVQVKVKTAAVRVADWDNCKMKASDWSILENRAFSLVD